jgi:hypothetical protein
MNTNTLPTSFTRFIRVLVSRSWAGALRRLRICHSSSSGAWCLRNPCASIHRHGPSPVMPSPRMRLPAIPLPKGRMS